MKNYYKPIVFVIILFFILLGISHFFVPKSNAKGNGIHEARANGVFGEAKDTIDVLVIGDSESLRVFLHYLFGINMVLLCIMVVFQDNIWLIHMII